MPDAAPEIDLRPDGTVTLTFTLPKGKPWKGTLRRPTIGELRNLEESLGRANDAVSDALAELPTFPEAPKRKDVPDAEEFARLREEYVALRVEYRKASDAFSLYSTDAHTAWFREVVETIGDGTALPGGNSDLPPWAVTGSLGPILLNHWTTVPLPVATR